jgi:small conductance mechanosensitive channel
LNSAALGAELSREIKRALDAAGIEIPFPYRSLIFKEPLVIDNQISDQKH